MNSNLLAVCLGLAGLALTGCVSVHKVTIQDAPRKAIEFESADAMRTFYDALLARLLPVERKPSRIIAGQTLYTRETKLSGNMAFNRAVTAADADGNGLISQAEATAYASRPGR